MYNTRETVVYLFTTGSAPCNANYANEFLTYQRKMYRRKPLAQRSILLSIDQLWRLIVTMVNGVESIIHDASSGV